MTTLPPLLFLAGSPGPLEVLVIFAVVLVLFGPRKLPEIARSLGRMLGELRKASEDFRSQVMSIDKETGEGESKPPPGAPDSAAGTGGAAYEAEPEAGLAVRLSGPGNDSHADKEE